jgi:hypothetical protein
MRTSELQTRLRALGLDPGPSDGIYGPLTEEAVFDALDLWAPDVPEPIIPNGIVPDEWMPDCSMQRVIVHWTAGTWKASSNDVAHYHILVEDDGRLVRGSYSIKDNVNTSDGRYAAHTKNCNTGSIGITCCSMANAVENPFNAGNYPTTKTQWDTMCQVAAELCSRYTIPITDDTVLSHGEVQANLGIAQSGKWDYTRLAFDLAVKGAKACGDRLRSDVREKQSSVAVREVETASSPEPPTA